MPEIVPTGEQETKLDKKEEWGTLICIHPGEGTDSAGVWNTRQIQ